MEQAKYDWIKRIRKARDAARAKARYGEAGHLARRIALWNRALDLKGGTTEKLFSGRKLARVGREHGRWGRKAAKWAARAARWSSHWAHKARRWAARAKKT